MHSSIEHQIALRHIKPALTVLEKFCPFKFCSECVPSKPATYHRVLSSGIRHGNTIQNFQPHLIAPLTPAVEQSQLPGLTLGAEH